ncbi:MAG TPA: hypothetical protein VGC87_03015 [Pyrinomonadaceae bacterium]|jgi:hypothetical protein
MKENTTQTTLSGEKLGDEKRIRAVLAGWGMDAPAIERMLDQHRTLRAEARGERPRRTLRSYPTGRPPATHTSPGAHTEH